MSRARTNLSNMTEEERCERRRQKNAEKSRRWRAANPEKHREQVAAWEAANPDKVRGYRRKASSNYNEAHRAERRAQWREWARKDRASHPDKHRRKALARLYGITQEEYVHMLAVQGGHCAACTRTPEQERHGVLHVDHDHTTGVVRGLLCHRCNTAFGLIAENLDGLTAYAKRALPLP